MVDPEILARRPYCWLYAGVIGSGGYGRIMVDGKYRPAHRVLYEVFMDTIVPEDKVLDHLCEVPTCINPAHLEIVTIRENSVRGNKKKRQEFCQRGHNINENPYTAIGRNGNRIRACRICRRKWWQDYKRKTRLERRMQATQPPAADTTKQGEGE